MMLLYSGDFFTGANFAELLPRPSEEIFVVLNFAQVLRRNHSCCLLISAMACTS